MSSSKAPAAYNLISKRIEARYAGFTGTLYIIYLCSLFGSPKKLCPSALQILQCLYFYPLLTEVHSCSFGLMSLSCLWVFCCCRFSVSDKPGQVSGLINMGKSLSWSFLVKYDIQTSHGHMIKRAESRRSCSPNEITIYF